MPANKNKEYRVALANTQDSYGWLARLLHWGIAGLIFYLIYLGLVSGDLEGEAKSAMRATHKSFALLTLALMTVRVIWRLMNPRPEDPAGTPGWQKAAALWAHWAIYAAVFFQLTIGILVAGQRPISFFGLFEIGPLLTENRDQHEFFEELHEIGWIVLAVLVGIHVLAAIYHRLIRKDNVLQRMTTG